MTIHYGEEKVFTEQSVGHWQQGYEDGFMKVVGKDDEVEDKLYKDGILLT